MKLALIYPAAQFLIKSTWLSLNIWHAQEDIFKALREDRFYDVATYINFVDVNTADEGGNTLLHYVCHWADSNFIEFLVRRGANVNKLDSKGRTPLACICEYYPRRRLPSNLQVYDPKTDEDYARLNSELHYMICFLIKNGADVSKNYEGYKKRKVIILHHNSFSNDLEIVKLMLENGADVNIQDNDKYYYGDTLLHKAIKNNNIEMITLLMENNADLTIRDGVGHTPLSLAKEYANYRLNYNDYKKIFDFLTSEYYKREELQKIENEFQAAKSEIKLGKPQHLVIERKDDKVKDIYYQCNNQINQNNISLAPIFSVRSNGAVAFLNHVQNN